MLDNCEHLIGAVADARRRACSPHCPRAAGRRHQPRAAGASPARASSPVPPLGLPAPGASVDEALAHPAVELFADRAAAAAPGFAVDARTSPRSSRSAAGSTACRWRSSSPPRGCARCRAEQLAARLDDRFRLLTGGSRTALAAPPHAARRRRLELGAC